MFVCTDLHTYAKDMIEAMLEINKASLFWSIDRKNKGLTEINLGQASCVGSVIFGTTGSTTRLEYTTIGNAVNNAAKLEKHTKEIGVQSLTTLEAFELAKNQGLTEGLKTNLISQQSIQGMKEILDIVILDT